MENQTEKYERLDFIIREFDTEDVICTSGAPGSCVDYDLCEYEMML